MSLAVGAKVTWLSGETDGIRMTIVCAVPNGWRAVPISQDAVRGWSAVPISQDAVRGWSAVYISATSEHITWLRGHHTIETSPELRALLAERALLA